MHDGCGLWLVCTEIATAIILCRLNYPKKLACLVLWNVGFSPFPVRLASMPLTYLSLISTKPTKPGKSTSTWHRSVTPKAYHFSHLSVPLFFFVYSYCGWYYWFHWFMGSSLHLCFYVNASCPKLFYFAFCHHSALSSAHLTISIIEMIHILKLLKGCNKLRKILNLLQQILQQI